MRAAPVMFAILIGTGLIFTAGCSDYREDEHAAGGESGELYPDTAEATAARFRAVDPTIAHFFDDSYGYVVFPKITKGAFGVGAAHGEHGVVYERGRAIGASEVTQVTLGAQAGGQTYSEIIFFKDKARLEVFKDGEFEFSANASAVAADEGAGAANDYQEGVAVFYLPRGGLMFEASIGGQKFTFAPYTR
jgi:lipid-binding SYLF domain-containing protein